MNDETTVVWQRVATGSEIPEDEGKAVAVGDRRIAIFNVGGTFYATDDTCTHEYASLAEGYVEGCVVECPLHAGEFDIRTGKALSPPVTVDIRTYPVRIEGDDILVRID